MENDRMTTSIERLSFLDLMNQIDEKERTQRDRGTLFELLTKAYLENEPVYRQLFDSVWLLKDVPEKYGIPKKDTGVDLVAKKRNSEELFAIQSKYYSTDYKIGKADIDSFLNEVGKSYYSEGIIITSTPHWTNNAESALNNRDKNISRIDLIQLQESRVDWSKFSFTNPKEVELLATKTPRTHQEDAIKAVVDGFDTADRGKLIMAPGTGKTYTSMVIAERLAEKKDSPFRVLYLVPSIQLLSQALKGWSADTKYSMDTIAVCSDRKVTKKSGSNELEDIAATDIGYPATTNYEKLLKYQEDIENTSSKGDMLVVFSTYQSIDVTIEAQKHGFYEFDLIIADEAHRTTGATLSGEGDSHFVKVHKNSNVKAHKRLYQTATPRIYGEIAHQKADEKSVLLYDMDNEELYGEELFYLGFGEAVHRGILSDYKVMILAVDENEASKEIPTTLNDVDKETQFQNIMKIIGVWNGLLKRRSNSNQVVGLPMKRAIAFTGTIKQSKYITEMFDKVINEYLDSDAYESFNVDIDHADGSMNALQKNTKIEWLKSHVPDGQSRILSNARFLTEGVDVPDLDAVLFMQPRRSTIDIAQAVGRVMRKAPKKEYGYVILPITVTSNQDPNAVLDSNDAYSTVWNVLNALRSIDERFDATINKLELNKKKPSQIEVVEIGNAPEVNEDTQEYEVVEIHEQLEMELTDRELTQLEEIIYAQIVDKVGNTRYWETWSKDVTEIAQRHINRINSLLADDTNTELKLSFNAFISGLRNNINNEISVSETVEMLAQHLVTKPVFDSLFEEESFSLNNPISVAMNEMIEALEKYGFSREQDKLSGFYESVHIRAQGIDNLEAKQSIIIQLYEKFFKVGFPSTTERLGIVFTPTEVVDFVVNSVEDALQKYLGTSMNNKKVNILDPFTGTGTFITRLLQSGVIDKENLLYKYTNEIYANELVLLSYYIAAINIEETFKELSDEEYIPYPGIVLTDTFESTEQETTLDDSIFTDNNERIKKQQESPITVIMGNPPYSAKQSSTNDNNANKAYPVLDQKIRETYVADTNAQNKNTLYDSYIRAIRWATDRIDTGVIGFVTNGSFIDSISTDGMRKNLYKDFNHIYIYNLRGNQRTMGEMSRKEGGKIFDSGSRAPIAISIMIKDGSNDNNLYYHEVEDYLTRDEKLELVNKLGSISNVNFEKIEPDRNNNWINQLDDSFYDYPEITSEYGPFYNRKTGIQTSRDAWVTNFSREALQDNVKKTIVNYEKERERIKVKGEFIDNELNYNSEEISWSSSLKNSVKRDVKIEYDENKTHTVTYRPFTKRYVYMDKILIHRPGSIDEIFPNNKKNILINTSGNGGSKPFSAFITNEITDINMLEAGAKSYPINIYSDNQKLFDYNSNINENFIVSVNQKLDLEVDAEEIFYYVYGVLHHPDYLSRFAHDLKRGLPRIPISSNLLEISNIGRELAWLHLNYEEVGAYENIEVIMEKENPSYYVEKMNHPWAKDENGKRIKDERGKYFRDKTQITVNKDLTVKNIPEKAYQYVVNGRSPVEWIIDQYKVKIDSKSKIEINPNLYSEDSQYVFNLLLSVINVSVQTVDLINDLPPLDAIN